MSCITIGLKQVAYIHHSTDYGDLLKQALSAHGVDLYHKIVASNYC